jgi:hypothetical protein
MLDDKTLLVLLGQIPRIFSYWTLLNSEKRLLRPFVFWWFGELLRTQMFFGFSIQRVNYDIKLTLL